MAGADFPIFIQARYRTDGQAETQFLADADRVISGARRKFADFADETQRTINRAISMPRNEVGSLNLGVDQLREAARAQDARAIAAREVANATLAAAKADNLWTQEVREAISAARSYATQQENMSASMFGQVRAAEAVQRELNKTVSATNMVVPASRAGASSIGTMRGAYVMLGQQMQDSVVQLQAGTSAMTVLVQQAPQAAYALTGLAGSANKTAAAIGGAAAFLSGPWGAAVLAATALAGPLIYRLIESSDAFKGQGDAVRDAVEKLQDDARQTQVTEAAKRAFGATIEGVTAALQANQKSLDDLNDSGKTAARISLEIALAKRAEAEATRAATQATLDEAQALFEYQRQRAAGSGQSSDIAALGLSDRYQAIERARRALAETDAALAQADRQIADALSRRQVELGQRSPEDLINQRYDLMIEKAREAAVESGNLGRALREEVKAIEALRDAEIKRNQQSSRSTRDPGQLTEFVPAVSGGRISGQYGEQRTGRRHAGIDIAVPVGTPVRAPAGGVVVESGTMGGYGNVIFIDHGGGTITRLAHLSQLGVAKGTQVAQGEVIGLSGGARGAPGAGNSRGPHLHQETLVNGRHVDPRGGRFRTDDLAVAREAERAAQAQARADEQRARAMQELADFGARADEQVLRLNEKFDEQPRLVDQAARATRELDAIIAELGERKPIGWEQTAADARDAQAVIQEALVRPFQELEEDSARRLEIDRLITANRGDEAEALQIIWNLESSLGPIGEKRKADILDMVRLEQEVTEELERQRDRQDAFLEANRALRSELESLFSGDGADFQRIAKQLQSQLVVEELFGDALRELDEVAKSGFDQTVDHLKDETDRAAGAAGLFADAIDGAAVRIANPEAAAAQDDLMRRFDEAFGAPGAGAANDNGPIVVTASQQAARDTVAGMRPEEYFDRVGRRMVQPLLTGMEDILGTKLAGELGSILGGAAGGYLSGGSLGAALGALKGGVFEFGPDVFGKGLTEDLLGAFGGASTGGQVNALSQALGLGGSSTGAALGGMVGSLLPIPGGDIIGAVAGNFLSSLFGSSKDYGTALLTSANGTSGLTSRGDDGENVASGLASSLQDSLKSIADQLDAQVGAFDVAIGMYDGNYRVRDSTKGWNGEGGLNFSGNSAQGLTDFGEDEGAALVYALANALQDGAIQGLSAAEQRLLTLSDDVEQALQDVLDFRSVFQRLREYQDPVGAALDELNAEFEDLADLFERAGASAAELAQLEELYGIERAQVLEESLQSMTGTLQGLLDDLLIGDSGLSLRDRQANALGTYNELSAKVQAGDTTAFDAYAEAAQQLLAIEREIYGSQEAYFARFDEVRSTTEGALAEQELLMSQAESRDSPFGASTGDTALISSVDRGNEAIVGQLQAVNDNLATVGRLLAAQAGANSSGTQLAAYGADYF